MSTFLWFGLLQCVDLLVSQSALFVTLVLLAWTP